MKKYSFILFPDTETLAAIERLREVHGNEKLVDGLPPHVTLKRRFFSKERLSADDILKIFEKFPIEQIQVSPRGLDQFGSSVVVKVGSPLLEKYHRDLLAVLGDNIVTDGPEWEGGAYNPHIMLVKGEMADVVFPDLHPITLNKIRLYEYEFPDDTKWTALHTLACRAL